MKLISILIGLQVLCFSGTAHAQRQDWRSCAVTVCSNGECDGPNSNLIVVAPADFADPKYGGVATMMTQLANLAERLYPAGQGWSHQFECQPKPGESYAMDQAKAYIQLAQAPPASREIKVADPAEVWLTAENRATPVPTPVAGGRQSEPAAAASPADAVKAKGTEGPGDPMNFMMWVDMREPINGVNSVCFHSIKMKPAPEGYRGQWPTLKNALPIIQSYFPMMLDMCSRRGTPVSANVSFATDDISPAAKRAAMQADVERWRKFGFPEVYISN